MSENEVSYDGAKQKYDKITEGDITLTATKRDELIKAIETAGFMVAGIEMSATGRSVNEKLYIGFKVKGHIAIDRPQLSREELKALYDFLNQPMGINAPLIPASLQECVPGESR